MSITPPSRPIPSFLPESAPFTPEQRAWLDGLFAGLFGLEGGVTPLSGADVARLLPELVTAAPAETPAGEDDGAPWHDPTIVLPERMKLAEGRPLPRRLMAAMAQQDCGQCGYNCKDYADALFGKKGKAAEPVRAGRQGHRPHAQAALSGIRERRAQGRCGGGARAGSARRARPLARQSAHRHLRLPPPPQQGRLGKGNLAHRIRSRRERPRLRGRRFLRHLPDQRCGAGRRRDRRGRRAAGPGHRRAAACATFCSTACRYRRRRTCCSSSSRI